MQLAEQLADGCEKYLVRLCPEGMTQKKLLESIRHREIFKNSSSLSAGSTL
jgi:hypothetical protein